MYILSNKLALVCRSVVKIRLYLLGGISRVRAKNVHFEIQTDTFL